jgi:NADPH2:quinone reductase
LSALGWGAHALAPLSFREATYSGVFTLSALLTGKHREHHGAMLQVATQLVEAGKLVPRVDPRSFVLANADLAYQAITAGTIKGKIVVDVQ